MALQQGVAVSLAGGTHHAFRDQGSGDCVINDAAIAALAMQAKGQTRRVLIVDCDVHQGDGTTAIVADDLSVFTFLIHGAGNFPFRKIESDLDVALPDFADDNPYLWPFRAGLSCLAGLAARPGDLPRGRADPFEGDRLGRLSFGKDGLVRRDQLLFSTCVEPGVPIATVMAGGYARNMEDTVDIHFNTVRGAATCRYQATRHCKARERPLNDGGTFARARCLRSLLLQSRERPSFRKKKLDRKMTTTRISAIRQG